MFRLSSERYGCIRLTVTRITVSLQFTGSSDWIAPGPKGGRSTSVILDRIPSGSSSNVGNARQPTASWSEKTWLSTATSRPRQCNHNRFGDSDALLSRQAEDNCDVRG